MLQESVGSTVLENINVEMGIENMKWKSYLVSKEKLNSNKFTFSLFTYVKFAENSLYMCT